MANGPQKPDHGGNFFMTPRKLLDSAAWRHLTFRARAILQVLQMAHNGFNNGAIAISLHRIGTAIGNQNHGANAKAVAELIQVGFLECVSDADHAQSKAREYRLTFVSTGDGKRSKAATNDYMAWRPLAGARKKFGGARTAPEMSVSTAVTASKKKDSGAVTATDHAEIRQFEAASNGAITAPHLCNQSSVSIPFSIFSAHNPAGQSQLSAAIDVNELREWMTQVLTAGGFGAQKRLAEEARVPESVLSKFKAKGNLPAHHRMALQSACGRHIPYKRFRQSLAAASP